MTNFSKRIEIAYNDEIEFFSRKLMQGLRIPASTYNNMIKIPDVGFLPGTIKEKTNASRMMYEEAKKILDSMANSNYTIIEEQTFWDGIKTHTNKKYIEFHDEITYTEFMLML